MMTSPDEYPRFLAEALACADDEIGELRARAAEDERTAANLEAKLTAVRDELSVCRAECAQLRIALAGVTSSVSWRVTTPLRFAAARARALRDRE
jgi:hypothetical protein